MIMAQQIVNITNTTNNVTNVTNITNNTTNITNITNNITNVTNQSNAVQTKQPQANRVPLYRYCNGKEHFYTTSSAEIGTVTPGLKGKYGYASEGIIGYVSTIKANGYVPLYRYCNGIEHFYTTNAHELGTDVPGVTGKGGYKCECIQCYCPPNGIPLYRYWNGKDHFYTVSAQEIGTITPGAKGRYGYTYEGIACYMLQ